MNDKGTIVKSISFPVDLWNDINQVVKEMDGLNWSSFVQSASRLKIKSIKTQGVREYIDSLSKSEYEILKNEILGK